ncbi:MAG: DUF2807 domain-containing protein [Paraburkholderia sp.]|uniref:GIN domain-containing protein n=1 Tax=Paraburkholderia sp. TaxID=1926495 RepID=UPI003C368AE2
MRVSIVRFTVAAICSVFACVAMAQSSGSAGADKTEKRQTDAFSGVRLVGAVEGAFSISPYTSVTVSAPAEVLPHVVTAVKNGVLTVELKDVASLATPLKVVITGPSLQAVSIAGSATMRVSGISDRSLALNVSGSGSILASGSVNKVSASISGSGDIDVSALHANALVANVQGSGDLHGYASDSATVNVMGSGVVDVQGKPAVRTVNRIGSGEVRFE